MLFTIVTAANLPYGHHFCQFFQLVNPKIKNVLSNICPHYFFLNAQNLS